MAKTKPPLTKKESVSLRETLELAECCFVAAQRLRSITKSRTGPNFGRTAQNLENRGIELCIQAMSPSSPPTD
jgi:hypothetical protein